jgi:hypothetical protein
MQVLGQEVWKGTEEGATVPSKLRRCLLPADMEKGCHFLHVLACVRLSAHPGLSEAVLRQVLEFLEDQSDIVSTMDHYYTAF